MTQAIGQYDTVYPTTWLNYVDEVITVNEREALLMAKRLSREIGILVGWSSGAAVAGANKYANQSKCKGVMVIVIPDGANRYLRKFSNWRYSATIESFPKAKTVMDILMQKKEPFKLVTIDSFESVGGALKKALAENIGHLPIKRGNEIVGKVERETLVTLLEDDPLLHGMPIMSFLNARSLPSYAERPYPLIDCTLQLSILMERLKNESCFIVTKDGTPLGIITRADVSNFNP